MRITRSAGWHKGETCPRAIWDCERLYCREHRLLYQSCDTAYRVTEAACWEDGGDRTWMEVDNECPRCKAAHEGKRFSSLINHSRD